MEGHRGEDGGDAFTEHGLAGTRGADKEDVMTASGGDFDSAFGDSLTGDVAEVGQVGGVRGVGIGREEGGEG